ncbi:HD domain-containing protein [Microbacterium sp. CFH 90308]|uniref:HD domain-containing protein n=1 Tax=Microbacterium salsuginis TaxID=2722803 RepID=A0ABX1K5Y9_9MICO|nr:HDIG domain-containing metalloprotein [Microbacterium sp. CFH 90308]NLP82424.1 HD domain-containing protein [Microbacterium sp. CFH 90308]
MTAATAPADRARGDQLRAILRGPGVPSKQLRDGGLIDGIPELAALGRTPQDPTWHPEGDVLVHSLWAADLAAQHADETAAPTPADSRELLVLAALWHDIGKPETTQRRNGRITSYGHAERGAEIAASLGRRLGLPDPLVRAASAIIATHMAHVSVAGRPSPKAVKRLRDRLRAAGASLEEWAVVVRCDGDARGAAARPDASIPWLRVAATLPPLRES